MLRVILISYSFFKVKYNKKAVKELSTYKSISILFLFVESDEQLDMATKMAETVTEKYSALGIKSVIIDRYEIHFIIIGKSHHLCLVNVSLAFGVTGCGGYMY